jgi:hypothetical protein
MGCTPPPATPPAPQAQGPSPLVAMLQPQPSNAPLDAAAATPYVFHVEMFLINPPAGSFSGNEDFWKTIDEQCVDPATADLLQRNGVRVGVAPLQELENFAKYLEGIQPIQKLAITGTVVQNAAVEMKTNLPEQCIFCFNKVNTAEGHTFGRSDNILNLSFEPAPRKPGQLRLTLCPMVRELHKQMQFTPLNNQYEVQYVHPQMFYDVNLRVDIPENSFLIVTPSSIATSIPSSVGNAFFIKEGTTQRQEQVLIVVPQPYQVQQKGQGKVAQSAPK